MVAHARKPFITPDDYLQREQAAQTKSEYWDGVIVAMAGASPEHVCITTDLLRHLGNQLEGTPCEPFNSDMRLRVHARNLYYYPDASVACGGAKYEERASLRSLLNPIVVVEVLSDSTERVDRGEKWTAYQTIESLQVYVIISQHAPKIEMFIRADGNTWNYRLVSGLEATLSLPPIGCEIKLASIYRRVEFVAPDDGGREEL